MAHSLANAITGLKGEFSRYRRYLERRLATAAKRAQNILDIFEEPRMKEFLAMRKKVELPGKFRLFLKDKPTGQFYVNGRYVYSFVIELEDGKLIVDWISVDPKGQGTFDLMAHLAALRKLDPHNQELAKSAALVEFLLQLRSQRNVRRAILAVVEKEKAVVSKRLKNFQSNI